MKKSFVRLAVFFFTSPVMCLFGIRAAQSQEDDPAARRVTIAVVQDGPSEYFELLGRQIEQELRALTEEEFTVHFKKDAAFDAGWDSSKLPVVLKRALDDPETGIVLALGVLATDEAARASFELTKPVVGCAIHPADLARLPYDQNGRSTKTNFTFVITTMTIAADLETFLKIVRAETIHAILDEKFIEGLPYVREMISSMEQKHGIKIVPLPAGTQSENILARLDQAAQAVYLTPLVRMSAVEYEKLIRGINERKIPSFSMMGYPDVQAGVLAGLVPDLAQRRARRIALNIQQIMLGTAPHELNVELPVEERLVINAQTASLIGYSPDFETLLYADFLHREDLQTGLPLSLETAMMTALQNNIDVKIKKEEVEASKHDYKKAASLWLPQIESLAQFRAIDSDRSDLSLGSLPQNQTTLGIQASQVIFNDEVRSRSRAARRAFEAESQEEQAVLLDVIETAGKRYLDYLSARKLLTIETENLKLTQSNLELAQVRHKVGTAGPEEVYRWEAEQARQRATVLEAETKLDQARVALNQGLGVDPFTRWNAQDIELGEDDYYFLDNAVTRLVTNEQELESFRRFTVYSALENSPALHSLQKSIEAQAILKDFRSRRYVLPSLSARFNYDRILDRDESPSELEQQLTGSGLPLVIPELDENEWVGAIVATYPLFEGGGRLHELRKSRSELERLRHNETKANQLLEQRALSALFSIESSHPKIGLTRLAADRARKNLKLVREKYAGGTVSILELLDAQNQAFVQELAAALAVYEYLKDSIEYQRAVSWFEVLKNESEKRRWIDNLKEFIENTRKAQG